MNKKEIMQMKRYIVFIATIFSFVCAFPFQVSANGPPPPHAVDCEIINMPEHTTHIDLLIQINENDEEYVDFNTNNGKILGVSEQSAIVMYNQDGFASFTFHFADASYKGFRFAGSDDQYEILREKYHIIKVALIDKDGNILQISDSVDINPPDRTGFFMGRITYDAAANTIDAPYYDSPMGNLLMALSLFFSLVFRMLLSSTIETTIAIPFNLRPAGKIFAINMVTQIFLNIFMAVCSLPYIWGLIIGEAAVYVSEFYIFKRLYRHIPVRRLAIFVVTANTVSLIIGLCIAHV